MEHAMGAIFKGAQKSEKKKQKNIYFVKMRPWKNSTPPVIISNLLKNFLRLCRDIHTILLWFCGGGGAQKLSLPWAPFGLCTPLLLILAESLWPRKVQGFSRFFSLFKVFTRFFHSSRFSQIFFSWFKVLTEFFSQCKVFTRFFHGLGSIN